jgi:hypothetical protein
MTTMNNGNISFDTKNENNTSFNMCNTINNCNSCGVNSNLMNINNQGIKKVLTDLDHNLEELLKSVKNDQDKEKNTSKTLYYTKNYSIYKKVFEEAMKLFPEYSKIFQKILNGFNEIIHNMLNENKIAKEKTENYEMMMTSKINIKNLFKHRIFKSK